MRKLIGVQGVVASMNRDGSVKHRWMQDREGRENGVVPCTLASIARGYRIKIIGIIKPVYIKQQGGGIGVLKC